MKEVDFPRLEQMLRDRPAVPAGKAGNIEVVVEEKPPGTELTVVSLRNAIFMGQRPTQATFTDGYTLRTLKDSEHGTWMTDLPQEVWQMAPVLDAIDEHEAEDVLIGGLGLGIVSHLAAQCDSVYGITTVELNPDIDELVSPYVHYYNTTWVGDLYEYLRNLPPSHTHDFAFFDIWQPTGEMVWQQHVVPLRRLARQAHIPHVLCWNEGEMEGQLRQALPAVACAGDINFSPKSQGYYIAFREAARPLVKQRWNWKDHDIQNRLAAQAELLSDAAFVCMLERYLDAGTDAWEREFGDLWDKHVGATPIANPR